MLKMQAVADIQRMHTCQIGDTHRDGEKTGLLQNKARHIKIFLYPLCMLMCFACILYIYVGVIAFC